MPISVCDRSLHSCFFLQETHNCGEANGTPLAFYCKCNHVHFLVSMVLLMKYINTVFRSYVKTLFVNTLQSIYNFRKWQYKICSTRTMKSFHRQRVDHACFITVTSTSNCNGFFLFAFHVSSFVDLQAQLFPLLTQKCIFYQTLPIASKLDNLAKTFSLSAWRQINQPHTVLSCHLHALYFQCPEYIHDPDHSPHGG